MSLERKKIHNHLLDNTLIVASGEWVKEAMKFAFKQLLTSMSSYFFSSLYWHSARLERRTARWNWKVLTD